jgi:hypothetical protein
MLEVMSESRHIYKCSDTVNSINSQIQTSELCSRVCREIHSRHHREMIAHMIVQISELTAHVEFPRQRSINKI